ncbi:MAG: hypothetical protein GX442_05175 [Candidatus Riflebacteria bacterium]|nr:hypothetical protein [Candidatus Riflebacteria bacterium]
MTGRQAARVLAVLAPLLLTMAGAMTGAPGPFRVKMARVAAETITAFRIDSAADGAVITFSHPMAVDQVTVSPTHPGVWGLGRAARLAVARTGNRAAVAGWRPGQPGLVFVLDDPWTDRISLTGLAMVPFPGVGPNPITPTWDLRIEGTLAGRRRLEERLAGVLDRVLERQTTSRCFCCHQVIPLGLATALARDRGLRLPQARLASWTAGWTGWQHPDGSFSFTEAPEFGVVTPTLCAAAVMAWTRFLDSRLEPALLKAVTFLVSLQQPDGSLVPDFTFPPLLVGRPAMAWLLGLALREVGTLLEARGFAPIPRLEWARQRIEAWLADPEQPGLDKALFAGLAATGWPPGPASAPAPDLVREVASFQRSLDPVRDPELTTLAELAGGGRREPPIPGTGETAASASRDFRTEAWGLLRDLLQEP